MDALTTLLIAIGILLTLDIAAVGFGRDSRETTVR